MAEKILIQGASETGKSTLARIIARGKKRVVAFDPTGDWSRGRNRWQTVETLWALNLQMGKQWYQGFQLAYTPPAGFEADHLHELSKLLEWYGTHHFHKTKRDPGILLIVDEASLSFSNAHAAAKSYGEKKNEGHRFLWVLQQGRHHGVGFVLITQYPNSVARIARSEAREHYVFAIHDADAREPIVKKLGREWEPALRTLKTDALAKAGFLKIEQGAVRRGVLDLKNQAFRWA